MSPSALVDYYAVLQVAPEAEREVIEAAYRQLMRKYHPDLAGDDELLAARLHERAKGINQAYAVLRDAQQRAIYDSLRFGRAARATAAATATATPTTQPAQDAGPAREKVEPPSSVTEPDDFVEVVVPSKPWWPLSALSTAYFLLPGAYEWESGSGREIAFTCLVPPLGVLVWLMLTGHVTWLGTSILAAAVVGLLGVVVLAVVHTRSLLRLVVLGGLVLGLASGAANDTLNTLAAPAWFAWLGVGVIGLAIGARLLIFGVVPTLAVCWLIGAVR